MRKLLIFILFAFLFSCSSIVKKDQNFNKVQIFYKGKRVKILTASEYFRIQYNSTILEKIHNAEENERLYVYADDEGIVTIVWVDEFENIIKIIRFKI